MVQQVAGLQTTGRGALPTPREGIGADEAGAGREAGKGRTELEE